jgi:hypothetical protein
MSPEIAARFAALEAFMRRSIGTMVGIAHVRIRQHAAIYWKRRELEQQSIFAYTSARPD